MNTTTARRIVAAMVIGTLWTTGTLSHAQTVGAGQNPLRAKRTKATAASHTTAQRAPVHAQQPPEPAASNQYITPVAYVEDGPVEYVVDGHCGNCGDCSECKRFCLALWGSVEYLLWWERGANVPPLVTTADPDVDRDDAGVIGAPGTEILFGGDKLEPGALSGARITLGSWFQPCANTGLGVRAFGIDKHSVGFSTNSELTPILARPFFNAFTGEPDALLLGFPGEFEGRIDAVQRTETQGLQAFLRHRCKTGCNYRVDWIAGYRYLRFDESIGIANEFEFIDPDSNNFGTEIRQSELFDTRNEFHGGEIGWMGNSVEGCWTLDFLATVSLGNMRERVTIAGDTVATALNGNVDNLVGGLLTQRSNIGQFENDRFVVIPEFTATLGYFITPRLDLSIGYTFLYVNRLTRPGRLIDERVNLTQQTGDLDGPAVPEFQFRKSDYWLQGLNFGLNLRY